MFLFLFSFGDNFFQGLPGRVAAQIKQKNSSLQRWHKATDTPSQTAANKRIHTATSALYRYFNPAFGARSEGECGRAKHFSNSTHTLTFLATVRSCLRSKRQAPRSGAVPSRVKEAARVAAQARGHHGPQPRLAVPLQARDQSLPSRGPLRLTPVPRPPLPLGGI